MKKKNGFTLIELLAVIVILAIIALIAVPVILNIIDKANKSALKDTAYGLISAGELYFAEQQLELNGMEEDVEFTFPTDEIDIKGEVPDGTILKVNTNGQTALAMSNGRYCITKGYTDTDVTVSEDTGNCKLEKTLKDLAVVSTELGINSIEACVEKGQVCEIDEDGVAFAIKVNNNETYKFYVISDDGNKVTLIMSENLGEETAWINADDYKIENNKDETPNTCSYTSCNDEGPITAINYLDRLTDEEWSNITPKEYTYSGLDEYGIRTYEDITRTMRARMLTYGEANAIKTANNGTMPTYTYMYMYGAIGYWTSTASRSGGAWYVYYTGDLGTNPVQYRSFDVRPVIELSK